VPVEGDEFGEFVRADSRSLLRVAWLLTGGTCAALHPVTVRVSQSAHVDVYCQEK
jgi:hypothetical protein